ncbi:CDP-alcohol phosphatidyltransferase family protein [Synechococcus sp. UW140]|uniref:CDP-alcohol phosphatidyltransferase family protein n=1 Tax=Synechococcus sp. UW140 TaxID=368503 RepID=UPI000E0F34AD|nr:CDP-alcohol phosphatidyltransferase family protein [Synechococcus sp. UW140]
MATIYQLKPRFQALLRPLSSRLVRSGVTANGITIAAIALSLISGAVVIAASDHPALLLVIPPTLLLRMALNALDGMIAREFKQSSRSGALMNELGDVISDTAMYLPFGLLPGVQPLLLALTVLLGVISEMAGVVAVQIGADRRYDGPLGKSDRAFAFGLLALLLGLGIPAGEWFSIVLAGLCLLATMTVVTRSRAALITR